MKISQWVTIAASTAVVASSLATANESFGFDDLLPEGQRPQHATPNKPTPAVQADESFSFSDLTNNFGRARAADEAAPSPAAQTGTTSGGLLKPFSTEPPSNLFKPNPGLATLAPIINVKQELLNTRAIPTNKWWGNLIHTTAKEKGVHSNPAWSNPYALKLPVGTEGPYGIQACYSYTYRKKAELKDNRIKSYSHEFHNDVTLSAAEFTAVPTYEIYDWTDMGVNLKVCSGAKCMDSALITGMAFISADYQGLTPFINSNSKVTKFEQVKDKYVMHLSNNQTWVMYTSVPGTFKLDNSTVKASAPYSGTIRLAVVPAGASTDVYDAFAGCVVRGGVVSVESRTAYTLNWQTNGTTCGQGGLLHFALQHHLDALAASKVTKSTVKLESSTRGPMSGIVVKATGGAAHWKLSEPELKQNIEFYAPRKIDPAIVQQVGLKEKLTQDINAEWVLDGVSYYFSGKAYQKYASLCLMADDTAIMGEDKTLKTTCIKKLQGLLDKFLTNSFPSPLVYDSTYRGAISVEGITKNDVNADFGNTIYNDHHYHYGYWVTASAMMRKLDPTWTRMPELETMVWTLLRDVANPSPEDKHFPTFRSFSWYLGHSVSHGATPMADGKDQESTSEDMNFYYGMMLWGKVTGNKAVEDLGSLMLRIDAHAIRTYFLMDSSNKVHPPEFVKNHVTGIFFDNKVDYATWFSPEKYCIHGIQMIPVSPINELIRSAKFVKEEWDDVLSKESIVVAKDMTNAWNSLLYANYAVVNKKEALNVLTQVKMDDGLTRSWALYMAATRPEPSVAQQ